MKKIKVSQIILKKESQRFLDNVKKLLPGNVKEFNINFFGIQKNAVKSGINYSLDVCVNNECMTLTKHSNDYEWE